MIPPHQHQELDKLRLVPQGAKLLPQMIRDGSRIVELIYQLDEQRLTLGPFAGACWFRGCGKKLLLWDAEHLPK